MKKNIVLFLLISNCCFSQSRMLDYYITQPYQSGNFVDFDKKQITYNNDSIEIRWVGINLDLTNTAYVPIKDTLIYDGNTNLICNLSMQDTLGNGNWIPLFKSTFSYNGTNDLIGDSSFLWSNSQWNFVSREVYFVTNNLTDSTIGYYLDTAQNEIPLQKWKNFYATGMLDSSVVLNYNTLNSQFEYVEGIKYVYAANKKIQETGFIYNAGSWQPTLRDNYVYDVYDSLIQIKAYSFNAGWEIYDSIAISRSTSINRKDTVVDYQIGGGTVPFERYIYRYIDQMGVKPFLNPGNDLVLYPNPAINSITVSSNSFINNIYVTDVNSKKLIATRNECVDISLLPSGIYFITVSTIKGNFTRPFVHSSY